MDKIDSIYNGQDRIPEGPKYKHFARWAYWWSSRVNPDGSFTKPIENNITAIQLEERTPSHSRSTEAFWTSIGPNESSYANNASFCVGNGYGRVDRIKLHHTNPNKIYVCTPSGGAWYSNDGGSNWSCLTDGLPIMGTAGIEIDPTNDQILYLLTGTTDNSTTDFVGDFGYRTPSIGVLKSIDHGQNWEHILKFDTIVNADIIPYRLKFHPLNSNLIFACTQYGVFRSPDKGNSWTRVHDLRKYDIEFHPTDPNYIYISGTGSVYYSNDEGITWNISNNHPDCNKRLELAVSAAEPNSVWVVAGGVLSDTTFCGYSKSINKGVSFSNAIKTPNVIGYNNSDQSSYDLCIAVNNNDPNIVVVGGIRLFKTENYNSSPNIWTNIAPYSESFGSQKGTLPNDYVHPDVHDLVFNPLDGKLYTCTDGGVYVSSNDGDSWTNITAGINVSQIYNLNLAPTNDSKIGIGLQDNGIKARFSSSSEDFLHINGGDGFEVVFSPSGSNRIATSVNQRISLYPSSDGLIRNWMAPDTFDAWFQPLSFRPDNPNKLYRGEYNMKITEILNDTILNSYNTYCWGSWEIETCLDKPYRAYSSGGANSYLNDPWGYFYRYNDDENTSDALHNTTGYPNSSQLIKVTDIAIDPDNCDNLVFSNGGYKDGEKVYYAVDSGSVAWINISYNLPNVPVHSLEIDENQNIYAGTEIGVYFLEKNKTTWLPFANNMPRVPVTDIEVNNDGTKLIAATFGRGVWQSDLPSACVTSKFITATMDGFNFFEVSNLITSNATINGGVGTNVSFHANDQIKLTPGFKVTTNCRFKAKLAPCGTGIE